MILYTLFTDYTVYLKIIITKKKTLLLEWSLNQLYQFKFKLLLRNRLSLIISKITIYN